MIFVRPFCYNSRAFKIIGCGYTALCLACADTLVVIGVAYAGVLVGIYSCKQLSVIFVVKIIYFSLSYPTRE